MARLLATATTAILITALLAGCELFDPPMGEVGMHITRNGKDYTCTVQAFNELGRQTQELHSNALGVVYVKRLVAGKWTFKFKDVNGTYLPAVRTITLAAGATAYLPVEVSIASDPEAEAAASSAVMTYGTDDTAP